MIAVSLQRTIPSQIPRLQNKSLDEVEDADWRSGSGRREIKGLGGEENDEERLQDMERSKVGECI